MESLYRKYRPQTFSDVVGQQHIVSTLEHAVAEGRLSHAYLFCGPRGTGKTTMARILAKSLLCAQPHDHLPCGTCPQCQDIAAGNHPDVYELDAASRTGVDNVREEIINSVSFAPVRGDYKIYIIDEVHMLTTQAFNALLKTLEEPPAHVVFVLATTDPQRVPETILSRCQRFDFHRIGMEDIERRLAYVCQNEGFETEPEALALVARHARGGMRDALSTLEQLSVFGNGAVRLADARSLLGEVASSVLADFARSIAARDVVALFRQISAQVDQGNDLMEFTRDLVGHVRDIYMARVAGADPELFDGGADLAAIEAEAALFESTDRLSRTLTVLDEAAIEMRTASDTRLVLEVACTRLARPETDLTLESLAERLARLEAAFAAGAAPRGTASGAAPAAAPIAASVAGASAATGVAAATGAVASAAAPVAGAAPAAVPAAASGAMTAAAPAAPSVSQGNKNGSPVLAAGGARSGVSASPAAPVAGAARQAGSPAATGAPQPGPAAHGQGNPWDRGGRGGAPSRGASPWNQGHAAAPSHARNPWEQHAHAGGMAPQAAPAAAPQGAYGGAAAGVQPRPAAPQPGAGSASPAGRYSGAAAPQPAAPAAPVAPAAPAASVDLPWSVPGQPAAAPCAQQAQGAQAGSASKPSQVAPAPAAAQAPAQASAPASPARPASGQVEAAAADQASSAGSADAPQPAVPAASDQAAPAAPADVPPAAEASVPGGPVTDKGELQRRWKQAVKLVVQSYPSRGALLQSARAASDDGDVLTVNFPKGSEFAVGMLEREDSQEVVPPIVAQVFGPRELVYTMGGKTGSPKGGGKRGARKKADAPAADSAPAEKPAASAATHTFGSAPAGARQDAAAPAAPRDAAAQPAPAAQGSQPAAPNASAAADAGSAASSVPEAAAPVAPAAPAASAAAVSNAMPAAPTAQDSAASQPKSASVEVPEPPTAASPARSADPAAHAASATPATADQSSSPTIMPDGRDIEADRRAWESDFVPYDDAMIAEITAADAFELPTDPYAAATAPDPTVAFPQAAVAPQFAAAPRSERVPQPAAAPAQTERGATGAASGSASATPARSASPWDAPARGAASPAAAAGVQPTGRPAAQPAPAASSAAGFAPAHDPAQAQRAAGRPGAQPAASSAAPWNNPGRARAVQQTPSAPVPEAAGAAPSFSPSAAGAQPAAPADPGAPTPWGAGGATAESVDASDVAAVLDSVWGAGVVLHEGEDPSTANRA